MIEDFTWPSDIDRAENDELNRVCECLEEVLDAQGDAEPVAGEMVSVDVSTCDEDNGNRVFGEIIDWQDDGSGNRIWLCSLDHYNYPLPLIAGVPEGWRLTRESEDRITIDAEGIGFFVARANAERISEIMLYALANDLAGPNQEGA